MTYTLHLGDCLQTLKTLPAESVQTCVTSPPYYGLRDYGHEGQIGLEPTIDEYVDKLVAVFREVRRVLRDDGTLWLNLGDSYASATKGSGGPSAKQLSNAGSRYEARKFNHGVKEKDLLGIPWRVAFALQADGWWLRSDIIWAKGNPMPESVTDRPTKAHEYIFLLSKSAKYFYDADAIAEPCNLPDAAGVPFATRRVINGEVTVISRQDRTYNASGTRNKRSVWFVNTKPYSGAHFATFPEDLILPCIRAGSKPGDTVLDPFMGSGTTGAVAVREQRRFVGCELNPDYMALAQERISAAAAQLHLFSPEAI